MSDPTDEPRPRPGGLWQGRPRTSSATSYASWRISWWMRKKPARPWRSTRASLSASEKPRNFDIYVLTQYVHVLAQASISAHNVERS